jgi:hypothetical protein
MSGQLVMFGLLTSPDMGNAISLPESAGGVLPCGSPECPTTSPSGQAPAHVSRLASLDADFERLTSGTSGRISETLSGSAALQRSLESRLRARLDVNGSPEYRLTWKHWPIGSRRLICALRASARPTSDSGFFGWPTPTVRDHKGGYEGGRIRDGKISTDTLDVVAQLAISGWVSPTAQDGTRGELPPRPQDTGVPLSQMAALVMSGWLTPMSEKLTPQTRSDFTPNLAAIAIGAISTSSSAATPTNSDGTKRGALSPGHSRWLMGFPAEWDSCGATAMQSCRKSPQSSSKRGVVHKLKK